MHATIVQLTEDRHGWRNHIGEDDVFSDNQDRFYNGIEERTDSDFKEDAEQLYETLGDALAGHGTEKDVDRDVIWVDIDVSKAGPLFKEPFSWFRKAVSRLAGVTEDMFIRDPHYVVEAAVDSVKDAYYFDGMYVLNENGYAAPISEWLRRLIRESEQEGAGRVRRFYLHASYDGNQ